MNTLKTLSQACKLDIMKKTQGQKNSKLKEKTQELKKNLRVSAILLELKLKNELSSTRMSSSMLFFARYQQKLNIFCETQALPAQNDYFLAKKLLIDSTKFKTTQGKKSRFRQN